jgi:hypothetical protein
MFLAVLCRCTLVRTAIKEKLQSQSFGGQILEHFLGLQNLLHQGLHLERTWIQHFGVLERHITA